jgi:hypothetical protein
MPYNSIRRCVLSCFLYGTTGHRGEEGGGLLRIALSANFRAFLVGYWCWISSTLVLHRSLLITAMQDAGWLDHNTFEPRLEYFWFSNTTRTAAGTQLQRNLAMWLNREVVPAHHTMRHIYGEWNYNSVFIDIVTRCRTMLILTSNDTKVINHQSYCEVEVKIWLIAYVEIILNIFQNLFLKIYFVCTNGATMLVFNLFSEWNKQMS